ncbi:hypothetical protein RF11_00681 [Thelohanellus kitauei]|uniref:Uncharacterized protein n=1 Tax=Thelohanellus kitauei TaxID=669202 RepID=A0A0C2NEC3_THEKT|nr:hypothetical protein RF11_00681 [Thelohanellus kitauei]
MKAFREIFPMQLLAYFGNTDIRGRRLFGRMDNGTPGIFPIESWNKYDAQQTGLHELKMPSRDSAAAFNHYLCVLIHLWIFYNNLLKDCHKQKASCLQSISGVEYPTNKK